MDENVKKAQEGTEIEVDVLALLKALLRGWWVILIAMLVFGAATFLLTKFLITPTYRSSFSAYVNSADKKEGTSVTSGEITASRSLTSTYSVIIKSQPVIEGAIKEAGLSYSYEDMANAITVGTVDDTEVIKVNVTTDDPDTSYALAKALEQVAADNVSAIVTGSAMKIVSHSGYPAGIYSPSYKRNVVLGVLLGFLLSVVILALREILDNRVKDADDLTKKYGVVVVGTIHDLKSKAASGYGYARNNRER